MERRWPTPAERPPAVVVESIRSAQRIVALNDAAARMRLRPGMPLADARAMYPALPVFDADAEADRRLLEAVAEWCDRYTPLVGLDPPDGLVLDITGCAHLFGGEAALARDLVERLRRGGLRARVAVADTVGCAWGVARYGAQGVVAQGGVEAAILPLPIAALRVEAGTVADLRTAGLVRVADLASRPRAPFAARFGAGLLHRLDQALGRVEEPIVPRLPVPAAMAEQRFADPVGREADVLGTIEQLAFRLAEVLERRGEGGRLFQLALFRADGAVHRLEIGTGAPLRDPPRVRKLFEERLAALGDACDPGFGYDMVRLASLVCERCDPAQTGLAGGGHVEDPAHENLAHEDLAHLIDRFGARFGLRSIARLRPCDTHVPENAVIAVPAHAPPLPRTHEGEREDLAQDSLSPTRPLRLLEPPEPVDATAEVPDGPPVQFSWRRVRHQILRAEGPERIAAEWWRNDRGGRALTRDYFRVESRDGMRAWLYREGLFGSEVKPPRQPRWFLHGLFV
ncbi:MAG: DNA polymerase Y family protein [Rhizobiales bacterium]|nr:DNA polymerase Y family protein [Hyphomicrobiales bacterium]